MDNDLKVNELDNRIADMEQQINDERARLSADRMDIFLML